MTDQVGVAGHGQRNASPWQAVGLILLLTTCLSGIFWALINVTQTPNPYYVWLMMWMAGISALLTCRILRRPLSTLGWTWNWRWVLIGYLIPIVYCLAASLGIWIFGIGGFPNTDVVHQAAESLGLRGTPDWVVIAMFVVVQGTAGIVDMSQPSQEAVQRTRAFARVIGPFVAAATLIVAIRLPDLTGLVDDLFADAVLPWILGAMMLVSGLIVIAFHQYWYSVTAVLISLSGWFVALRGLTLMAFPSAMETGTSDTIASPGLLLAARIFFLLMTAMACG